MRPVFDSYPGSIADFGLAIAVIALAGMVVICFVDNSRLRNRIARHEQLTHSAKTRISNGQNPGRHIAVSGTPAPPLEPWEKALMDGAINLSISDPTGETRNEHYVGDGCPGGHEGTAEAFGLGEGDPGPAGARHG